MLNPGGRAKPGYEWLLPLNWSNYFVSLSHENPRRAKFEYMLYKEFKHVESPVIRNEQWFLNFKQKENMNIAKVKIFTSKISYNDLEKEVNKFLATIDYSYIRSINWHDADSTASVLVSWVEENKERKLVMQFDAACSKDLESLIRNYKESQNFSIVYNIEYSYPDGRHHAKLYLV